MNDDDHSARRAAVGTPAHKDKTLKLYEGHFHDLLNDIDKEKVIADIKGWIDARLPAAAAGLADRSAAAARMSGT